LKETHKTIKLQIAPIKLVFNQIKISFVHMRLKFTLLLSFIIFHKLAILGKTIYEEGYIVTLKNDTIYGKIADRKDGTFPEILKPKIRINVFCPLG